MERLNIFQNNQNAGEDWMDQRRKLRMSAEDLISILQVVLKNKSKSHFGSLSFSKYLTIVFCFFELYHGK